MIKADNILYEFSIEKQATLFFFFFMMWVICKSNFILVKKFITVC